MSPPAGTGTRRSPQRSRHGTPGTVLHRGADAGDKPRHSRTAPTRVRDASAAAVTATRPCRRATPPGRARTAVLHDVCAAVRRPRSHTERAPSRRTPHPRGPLALIRGVRRPPPRTRPPPPAPRPLIRRLRRARHHQPAHLRRHPTPGLHDATDSSSSSASASRSRDCTRPALYQRYTPPRRPHPHVFAATASVSHSTRTGHSRQYTRAVRVSNTKSAGSRGSNNPGDAPSHAARCRHRPSGASTSAFGGTGGQCLPEHLVEQNRRTRHCRHVTFRDFSNDLPHSTHDFTPGTAPTAEESGWAFAKFANDEQAAEQNRRPGTGR